MLLNDFLSALHREVRERVDLEADPANGEIRFPETVFTEIFAGWMAERGIIHEPQDCRFSATIDGQAIRLSGYALSDELDQLDLFVSIYGGDDEPRVIREEEASNAALECGRFLELSVRGTLGRVVDESHDALALISTIAAAWQAMPQVCIHVLTDLRAGAMHLPDMDILGRAVPVELVDIERVFDWRQDVELQYRFRALASFRSEWLASVREAAADDGDTEIAAFAEDAGRRLTEAEEFTDFQRCSFASALSDTAAMRVDGYAFDEVDGSLALVIADFAGTEDMSPNGSVEAEAHYVLAERFVQAALAGDLTRNCNPSCDPGIGLAADIVRLRAETSRVRVYLVTDRLAEFGGEVASRAALDGLPVERHAWDVARFHKAWVSDSGRDDLEVDFRNSSGRGIPALHAGSVDGDYEGYLCTISGAVLAAIYERHGSRLLEGNVRSFLSTKGKINAAIQQTIGEKPEMFFAYNNGIAATAEAVEFDPESGSIVSAVNLQIVNGGQTTASLAAAVRSGLDVSKVLVQMKLSVLSPVRASELIPLIARFANSQNKVNESDFFANHPYHLRLEQLSKRILAPAPDGGEGTHWYYERSRGQYVNEQKNLSKEGKKQFLARNPKSQLLTKLDVAKFENAWRGYPDRVSRGAQKSFVFFAGWLAKRWKDDDSTFDEHYFKKMVAMAILFRQTELIVKEQPWFQNAYRANIVAYTIALLQFTVLKTGNERKQLDLDAIWERQSISPALSAQIALMARAVFDVLVDPERLRANVTEWAKQEPCWSRVRHLGLRLSQDVIDELFDPASLKYASGGNVQQIGYGVFARTAVLGIPPEQWQHLLNWGREHALLDAAERRVLSTALRIPKFVPSVKECELLWAIRSRLMKEGFEERGRSAVA
jgi:hypothetical protein